LFDEPLDPPLKQRSSNLRHRKESVKLTSLLG